MIFSTERFLVDSISKNSDSNNVDGFRFKTYHKKSFQLDLEKLPPTSSLINIHIKRAYLQCYLRLHAPFVESIQVNPEDYGYEFTADEVLLPIIVAGDTIPEDFPVP